jgi:hypothetical protein
MPALVISPSVAQAERLRARSAAMAALDLNTDRDP